MLGFLFKAAKTLLLVFVIVLLLPAIVINIKQAFDGAVNPKVDVALLSVNGMIADAAVYTKRLDALLKDENIKGLILRINSPGGYSGCCQAIFNEVTYFAKKKPVVAIIENVGASGSYYIAAGAHRIIASPLSLVGSIGNYLELKNIKKLLADWHVECSYVQTGKYKTAGSMTKDLSADEATYLQKLSDDQYNCFVQEIAQARKLDAAQHQVWADGQIFTGKRALELKLIDQLGSMTDAVAEIKKLAKLDDNDQVKLVVHSSREVGLLRQLLFGEGYEDGQDFSLASGIASVSQHVTAQFAGQQVPMSVC